MNTMDFLSRRFGTELEGPYARWFWLGDNPNPNHKWSCNKCGHCVKEQENFCPNCKTQMIKMLI
jgi:rubrerythrin